MPEQLGALRDPSSSGGEAAEGNDGDEAALGGGFTEGRAVAHVGPGMLKVV